MQLRVVLFDIVGMPNSWWLSVCIGNLPSHAAIASVLKMKQIDVFYKVESFKARYTLTATILHSME